MKSYFCLFLLVTVVAGQGLFVKHVAPAKIHLSHAEAALAAVAKSSEIDNLPFDCTQPEYECIHQKPEPVCAIDQEKTYLRVTFYNRCYLDYEIRCGGTPYRHYYDGECAAVPLRNEFDD